MELRSDGDKEVGQALDAGYVLFLGGTRRLNEFISTPRPDVDGILDWVHTE